MHLLAASAGGGLLIGAGIRLAENRRSEVSSHDYSGDPVAGNGLLPFLARLEALEKRVALHARPSEADTSADDANGTSSNGAARGNGSIDEITAQIAAVEKRIRQDLEQRHERRSEELTEALEKRLAQRIAPIEAEIENQRTAVIELRDFSLRTETNLQRLLEGIEKLVVAQQSVK